MFSRSGNDSATSPRADGDSDQIEKVYAVGKAGNRLLVRCYNEEYNFEPGGAEFFIDSPFSASLITDIV